MSKSLFQMMIGCLGVVLFIGCTGPEEKAQKLLAQASQLLHSAQEAEKTNYSDAFTFYQEALAKAETITARYPSSQLATQLAQGEVRIGPYTITELKDTIVPQAQMKAEVEESPLACALLVASRIPPSTLIVGTDEVLDARPEVVAKIVDKYAQAEQCTQVLQVARMTGVPFPKDWMFTEIAHKCAAAGQYDQAFKAATTLENAYTKATALAEIANSYAQAGQKEKAVEMLSQSLQIAGTLKDNTALLTEMARKSAQVGQYDQAVQIAKTIEDGHVRADLLVEIAFECVRAGQYTQAYAVARELEDDVPSKGNVLAEIVRKYVKVGQYDQALQVANTIPHPYTKASVLAEVANKYMEAGQEEKAAEILLPVLQAANTQSAYFRVATLVAVASTYTAVGQKEKALELLSQALQVANSVGDTPGVFPSNATALEAIAGAVAEAGLYDQALEIADTIKGTSFPVAPQVFLGVVYKYAAAGQYDRAVEVAEAAIQEVPSKTMALVEIAGKCIEAGQKEKAVEIASRALQVAQAIEDDSFRIWKLDEIADIYTKADQREKAAEPLSQALQVVQTIKDSKVKAGALTGIALKYAAAGYSDQALELIKTITAAGSID